MGKVVALTGKELKQMFLSPIAYVFLMAFVVFCTFFFFRVFFLQNQASLAGFFFWVPIAFSVFVPGVVMRMWAEERRQGTLEFLLTSPVETWQVVISKFLAGASLVTACMLLTLIVPYTVGKYGPLDHGPVWGGYIGSVLFGLSCLAVGMFCSAFTEDQIVSFLVSVFVLLALVLIGHPFVQTMLEPGSQFAYVARAISPYTHFESIGRGVIDIRDIYYYCGAITVFLYLNTVVIDLRRWR